MKRIPFLSSWLHLGTYSFDKYIDFIENNFESTFSEIEEKFKELHAIPEDDPIREREEYHQSYYDHLFDSAIDEHYEHDVFQQRYRYSVIIQLFIFFETEMTRIINYHKEEVETNHRGTFLEKAKMVFKAKVNITTFAQHTFLMNFLELRNVLVHYNGKVKSSQPKIDKKINCLKALKKVKGFTLKETENIKSIHYEVKIEEQEFLKYSLKQIEDFLNNLHKELKKD
ncbi:hypothetical protein [Bizionia sp. M204]|uniref:hypothetical protein n=1 Tax=Bizionia sp. M204 TaxID=2675331 RepID=UPI002046C7ED|nr:hypothetical protein [Bizionia sp. M204]UPS91397.1 hypothetical protein GMA17_06515 [Bizionia sp. M204]